MKYQIIEAVSPEDLGRKVRIETLSDWSPCGGVAIAPMGDESYLYVQAMVKDAVK